MKPQRRVRGVSLIEALVALGVLAFGMLGMVGLQTTMRQNADIAKQRSEAVRIAQERIELARGYTQLAGVSGSYAAIASQLTPQTVTDYTTNTTYTWTATVPTPSADPPIKTYEVRVAWTDRSAQDQEVVLRTQIAGVAPELAGSLGVPGSGSPTAFVRGRHAAIPRGAVLQSDGTSRFNPPGIGDVGWVFNNVTGLITLVCEATFTTCAPFNGLLLSGFIRFDLTPPPLNSEAPPSSPFGVGVRVNYSSPTPGGQVECSTELRSTYVAYYCAMPVTSGTVRAWSGTPELHGLSIATSVSDPDAGVFRVCRYTPDDTDTPTGGNIAHPRTYTNVLVSLPNQNYLVIRAGDGSTAYACPDDGPSPYTNTNTWDHQPPRP